MIQLKSESLVHRLPKYVLIASLFGALLISTIHVAVEYVEYQKGIDHSFDLIEKGYVSSVSLAAWNMDTQQETFLMDGLLKIPYIHRAELSDDSQGTNLVFGSDQLKMAKTRTFDLRSSPLQGNQVFGKLIVSTDLSRFQNYILRKILVIFGLNLLFTILMSGIVYATMERVVFKHLFAIVRYIKTLNPKQQGRRLILDRKNQHQDELSALVHAIEDMHRSTTFAFYRLEKVNSELEHKIEEKTQAILEQRKSLEYSAKMTALGEMAGGISHEINNPLTIILGKVTQIRHKIERGTATQEQILSDLDKVDDTVIRIARIIKTMRGLTRQDEQEAIQAISLRGLIEDVISFYRERIHIGNITVHVLDLPDITIECRPTQIQQVFMNLIANAYDAIHGTANPWISISAAVLPETGEVEIIFTDSGTGIRPEVADKIMQPFFTTKSPGKGTGLGLSISRSIVTAHEGDLALDKSSANTRFIIRLPLKRKSRQQKNLAKNELRDADLK